MVNVERRRPPTNNQTEPGFSETDCSSLSRYASARAFNRCLRLSTTSTQTPIRSLSVRFKVFRRHSRRSYRRCHRWRCRRNLPTELPSEFPTELPVHLKHLSIYSVSEAILHFSHPNLTHPKSVGQNIEIAQCAHVYEAGTSRISQKINAFCNSYHCATPPLNKINTFYLFISALNLSKDV